MSARAAGPGRGGFTLLEVLISVALFALVVSSVYGAYRVTFQTVHGSRDQAVLSAAARVILERISEDLTTIATDKNGYLQGERGDVDGRRADGLRCVSYAHLPFNRTERSGGRTELVYAVEENESGLIDLYRSDSPDRPGERETEETQRGDLLGRDLLEFRLTYVSKDGSESEQWSSGPEEEAEGADERAGVFPALVRVEIRLGASPEDETGMLFRTAVALPARPAQDGEGQ